MALKTDYKADIFEGNRKYQISTDAQGKSEIMDITVYRQEGDVFGPEDINAITSEINHLGGNRNVTFPVAGWTGTAAPYTQTVNVAGVTADDIPGQGVVYPTGCTRAQQMAINKAVGYIYDLETGDGTVTLRCTKKPTVDITLGLKGVV